MRKEAGLRGSSARIPVVCVRDDALLAAMCLTISLRSLPAVKRLDGLLRGRGNGMGRRGGGGTGERGMSNVCESLFPNPILHCYADCGQSS